MLNGGERREGVRVKSATRKTCGAEMRRADAKTTVVPRSHY